MIQPATDDLPLPSDRQLLQTLLEQGLRSIVTVPCSITAGWHAWAREADRSGELELLSTTHEGNLIGLAAGHWFGSGQPALVHLQNSGLANAADGFVSFASPEVFAIPLAVIVTYRGATRADDSEPHQAVGERTDALVRTIFGDRAVINGDRNGHEPVLRCCEQVLQAARRGGHGVLKLSPYSFRASAGESCPPERSATIPWSHAQLLERLEGLESSKGVGSTPASLLRSQAWSRDGAIAAILALHPRAAMLFSNGYTCRAAQAIEDRASNFYNVGYMGGTMAIAWSLARSRPDLEVVVVDGDQNAQMSAMKDHLLADYPPNLFWYVLNNGVGASVGGAASLPLSPLYGALARVIPTTADGHGAFPHPRVRMPGQATIAGQAPPTLAPLARRFRDWIAASSPAPVPASVTVASSAGSDAFRGDRAEECGGPADEPSSDSGTSGSPAATASRGAASGGAASGAASPAI